VPAVFRLKFSKLVLLLHLLTFVVSQTGIGVLTTSNSFFTRFFGFPKVLWGVAESTLTHTSHQGRYLNFAQDRPNTDRRVEPQPREMLRFTVSGLIRKPALKHFLWNITVFEFRPIRRRMGESLT
jgi:hypothetical protein